MSGSEMFKVEISSPPVTSVEELVPVSGSAKSSEDNEGFNRFRHGSRRLKNGGFTAAQHHHAHVSNTFSRF